MKNRSIAKAIVYFFGVITIALSIGIYYIDLLRGFLGKYLLVIQIPMMIGAIISISGVILMEKMYEFSKNLIIFGSLIGITNIFSLFSIIILNDGNERNETSNINNGNKRDNGSNQKSYSYIMILPVLISYSMLAAFIAQMEDKTHIPLNWNGRNGLTLLQTLWDTDVFWGELWFNLMMIALVSGMLLIKFPPSISNWKLSKKTEKMILIISASISVVLIISMLISWDFSFNILNNWYSTQFAYQLPAWIIIIGLCGAFIFSIKKNTKEINEIKGFPKVSFVCFIIFVGLWLYLVSVTNFHPHALFDFGMPLMTSVMTIAFPLSFLLFILQRIKKNNPVDESNQDLSNIMRKTRKKGVKIWWFILIILGFVILVGLQYYNTFLFPIEGSDSMFGMEIGWTWPLSHWPSWMFIISTTITIIFSARYFYQKNYINTYDLRKSTGFMHLKRQKVYALCFMALFLIAAIPTGIIMGAQISARNQPLLLVNQVGYFPNAPKRVVYQSPTEMLLPDEAKFDLINSSSGEIIFSGSLFRNTSRYGHSYMIGNFDSYDVEGDYYIKTTVYDKVITSPDFVISENIYDLALERNFRFFYYQRCNYEVKEVVSGYLGHEACHEDDAEVWNGTDWVHHDLTGGWHDAGDYNKYNSWFQTQWYCTQALIESAILDPNNVSSNVENLYDSDLPDALDEALWGNKYLINCINKEGIQGEDKKYMVWETVSGYRQDSEREARMSYWGPPEMDWTTPRRVVFNQWNSTFVGYNRGYDIAGTLMHTARLIDNYTSRFPGVEFPKWAETNTTYLRELAGHVYDKYISIQGANADDVQSYIGKFYYLEEKAIENGNDWTETDALILDVISKITDSSTYALWFGWAGYYMFGNILTHYITFNRTLPVEVVNKITQIQENNFVELFDEPFRVKHVQVNGIEDNVLFYGAERLTDMLTNAWLQMLICRVNSTIGKPEIVQSMLDFIFGINPSGLCWFESLGDNNLPQYHHRYSYSENPSGAVPGALPNTVALAKPSREYMKGLGLNYTDLDILLHFGDTSNTPDWPGNPLYKDGVSSSPNEVWIPYNAMLIRLLVQIESENPFN